MAFERTDRRGPVFDRLREDVDVAAAFHGMQDVVRLRAADTYRVVASAHAIDAAGPYQLTVAENPAAQPGPARFAPKQFQGGK